MLKVENATFYAIFLININSFNQQFNNKVKARLDILTISLLINSKDKIIVGNQTSQNTKSIKKVIMLEHNCDKKICLPQERFQF